MVFVSGVGRRVSGVGCRVSVSVRRRLTTPDARCLTPNTRMFAVALDMDRLREKLQSYLEEEMDRGYFPGASWAIGAAEGILLEGALGYSVVKPAKIRAQADTIYDIA